MMTEITIEVLESLATELESDAAAQRARLTRLVRAYARILAVREPHRFKRQPLEYGDEAGHSDNSFPPKLEYRNRTGPSLIKIWDNVTEEVPTSTGFYYDWKLVTKELGLWVSRDGQFYGCEETGTGRLGQFAARPGDCDVEVELEWVGINEPDLDDLRAAEETLRKLAFPLQNAAA